jgi:ADP-ribose pyrophosphatase YjhB (NUDIX family)
LTLDVWRYRAARRLGKSVQRLAALLTLERMPPFVSAAAIVERDGSILMIRDTAQRQLVLPGGHLRWRESVAEGVRREVREETGYDVEPESVISVQSGTPSSTDTGIVRIVMSARIVGGRERSSAEGDVEWVQRDQCERGTWRDAAVVREFLKRAQPVES